MTTELGIAAVGADYEIDGGGGSHLANIGIALSELNCDTVKLFASSRYATNDYPLQSWGSAPTTLAELLADTDYAALISQFNKVLLNCWTFSGLSVAGVDPYKFEDGTYNARAALEYDEYFDLASYLLTTYSDKTFHIGQSEGDWQFVGTTDPDDYIPARRTKYMLGMLQARQRAINDARKAVNSTSVVKHVVELNLVYDTLTDTKARRLLRQILPSISPDIVSYSCYDSITPSGDPWRATQADMLTDITLRLDASLDAIREAAPDSEIIIGECGLPEAEVPVGYDSRTIIEHIYDNINNRGDVSTLYLWNLWDNEDPRGYYMVSQSEALSGAGAFAAEFLGG